MPFGACRINGKVEKVDHKPPTPVIESAHRGQVLPFQDDADFRAADRGFIAALSPCVIRAADGRIVWDNDAYAFLDGPAPTSVHPSLWRQSTLAAKQGLYEVMPGIYQVRGLDISNVTFVETDNGIIVIDPLISTEVAAAALALYREHRGGDRPVVAVIYTHSHVDHFGGVLGVTSQADVDAGTVAVLAPEGFIEHAVSENVYAGPAMTRRATYMYGTLLPRGPMGQVGCALGQAPSTGEVAVIVPTVDIATTGETHTIDGVEIEFQMAPGTEAPAEMHFYFPRFRALCMAENATHNLHNLLTLRGAVVRDPHAWSGYLTEAIDAFADRADVVFASHHWPTWGRDSIVDFLSLQRDLYAYLHDQTLRLLNQGYTGVEIAEMFQMPPALERAWHTHGYYGSVSHNVKAVYQRYMGWFDGNPARLWPHPPEALAPRYVEAMGGIDRVVDLSQKAFDSGDYRWAATLLDHAVFTDSAHAGARALYSDTLEQLAYGAENATWRNFFLSGAMELRDGNVGTATTTTSSSMLTQLTPEQIFDSLSIRVNGPRSWDLDVAVDVTLADTAVNYRLALRNGVLVHRKAAPDPATASVTVKLAGKIRLLSLATGDFASAGLELSGDRGALQALVDVLDGPDPSFNIVTP
ncbi:MBL fold metallo-hydrolase [Mycobacterium intracellulare]|uniref:Linear primary-alkylsulfatase n=1 Tax=Mycobacterium intracellulare TaxID=1767 RepID=A0AAE4REL8_MYCIT|nr:alkyl sulfatase dimerization domain-containing protein [Mycobacterium intracellulare]MCA2318466.1 MBL fold metallo-hydrolase [Mycobacterium intracellulare]MCA2339189.1 MBL fold metallo-hydrolase [Mycobacterium intracellulare]MDV6975010.1 alkyl sulfatase dimerization domain-containing protein [Mycobacterium intracellulare]MDV6981529.1 alkyl sulfatase dimerization domain-containing protein [Mycobacterium intracellulare]MDV7011707.1 alkyl sulfatase dimerization domain-containing protein [Mycob